VNLDEGLQMPVGCIPGWVDCGATLWDVTFLNLGYIPCHIVIVSVVHVSGMFHNQPLFVLIRQTALFELVISEHFTWIEILDNLVELAHRNLPVV
jgi:hypothetical protein